MCLQVLRLTISLIRIRRIQCVIVDNSGVNYEIFLRHSGEVVDTRCTLVYKLLELLIINFMLFIVGQCVL